MTVEYQLVDQKRIDNLAAEQGTFYRQCDFGQHGQNYFYAHSG